MQYSKIITEDLGNIIAGINEAAAVITSTMGGTGRNVIITRGDSDNIVFTKDGVSVAEKIRPLDPEKNIGAQLLINAANKTVEECGDGTTLTSLFVKEFIDSVNHERAVSPDKDLNTILDGVRADIEDICDELTKRAQHIEMNHDIYKVAYSSAKSPKIAKFMADIYAKTGLNANISLEESRVNNFTTFDVLEGLNFETGMVHPMFANQENGTCILDSAFVVMTDKEIQYVDDYSDMIDELHNKSIPILFIAQGYSNAFLRFCVTNVKSKGLKICLVRMPGYAKGQMENIRDIKAFIDSNGICQKVVVTPYEFTLFNTTDKQRIKARVAQLTKLAEAAVEDYDEKDYLKRIHRLQQSGAVIYAGGYTPQNAKEEFDRIEDAIGAVKAAIRSGFVRGAGIELINMIDVANTETLKRVLSTPAHKILLNANYDPTSIKDWSRPFNTRTREYDDNIIDPVAVLTQAMRNSFALVELLINTSYLVYNE